MLQLYFRYKPNLENELQTNAINALTEEEKLRYLSLLQSPKDASLLLLWLRRSAASQLHLSYEIHLITTVPNKLAHNQSRQAPVDMLTNNCHHNTPNLSVTIVEHPAKPLSPGQLPPPKPP